MRRIAAPLALSLLFVCFYWKLTISRDYTFLDSPDLVNLDFPRLQYQAESWRNGYFPFWDPNQWNGQPFLGQVTGAAYPVNWFLRLFPTDAAGKLTVASIHWYVVLIRLQAALFCYLLCRDWKRSRAASVLGGIVFGLGGFIGYTDWPQLLNGVAWLPLVLLFLTRALRGRRAIFHAALAGAVLGVCWLSGHHEGPIYASAALGFFWLAALAISRQRPTTGRLLACFAIAAGCFAAFQLIPAREFAKHSKRWVGAPEPVGWREPIPYSVHQHYSWSPAEIPAIVTPRPTQHIQPFIGIAAFALAALGIFRGRRLPQVRVCALLGGFALLTALGGHTPVHRLLYDYLPGFGMARVPARALSLFGLAAAPLAAYGMDALRRRSSVPWVACTAAALAGLAAVLLLAEWTGARSPVTPKPVWTMAMAGIAAALLAAWRMRAIPWKAVAVALPALAVWEISAVTNTELISRHDPNRPGLLDQLDKHEDIAAYLRAQPQPFLLEVQPEDITYNFGDWHNLPMLGGFAAGVTNNLFAMERHRPHIHDMLGIRYYVARTPPRPDLELAMESATGIRVYRNPAALPRAWAVHRTTQQPGLDAINGRMADAGFRPREEALLLAPPPPLETCTTPDTVTQQHTPDPNTVQIDVQMGCRGMVILSDTYFPGWKAYIDGRESTIWIVNGAFRGVVAEAGSHRILYRYFPASARWGLAGLAAGIGFVTWTGWKTRKRRKL
ncbi:MAG TPA: hypothetical protein VFQ91_10685 [Bryobacteraceae bacterium]|nr:hypothetical protein [Bryobacteraceae bacterium]